MRRNILLLLAGISLAFPANAATNCKKIVTPVEEAICESKYDQTVNDLKAEYKKLLYETPEEIRDLLQKEQSAWENFRNAHCDYEAIPMGNGNTMSSSVEIWCKARLNTKRIVELKEYPEFREQP